MPRVQRRSIGNGYATQTSKQTRIVVPQSPERPFKVQYRQVTRGKYQPSPWWWISHRRGIYRPKVGLDSLEARAVSKSLLRGTLPERIVYQYLVDRHLIPGVDFSFQSSLDGGRLQFGGIVVDFLLEPKKLVVQVQGPTHSEFLRNKKDEEQKMILAGLGYEVADLDMELIYNEPAFEDAMRQILSYPGFGNGHVQGAYEAPEDGQYDLIRQVGERVEALYNLYMEAKVLITGGL